MTSHAVYVAARVLIASVFVGLGAERLLGAAGVLATAGDGLGAGALAFSAFELAVGLLIAAGWWVRPLAVLMVVFLLVDAFASHPFWAVAAEERHDQLLHFLKNGSMIGGLVLLAWVGDAFRQDASRLPNETAP